MAMANAVTAGWENFFVAEAGAAAAFAGLLFVAVSINLARILSLPHLPARAAETFIALLALLSVAMLGLVPGQSAAALGVELAAVGVAVIASSSIAQFRARRSEHFYLGMRILSNQVPAAFFVGAGASLLAGSGGGLLWVAPGTLMGFAGVGLNAWVLLVEIQR